MSEREEMSELRDELVQIAAVAVAIIEDLDYGEANNMNVPEREGVPEYARISQTNLVLSEVDDERYRQDSKWGPQSHSPMEWLAILGEEYGEACKAALESHEWPERQQAVFDGTA